MTDHLSVPQRLADVARELEQRVAVVHQVVACPRCHAGVGVRCVHVRRGGTVKHPHVERLAAAGIRLR